MNALSILYRLYVDLSIQISVNCSIYYIFDILSLKDSISVWTPYFSDKLYVW